MSTPDSVQDHYRRQQLLTARTVRVARRQWARLGADLDAGWAQASPALLALLAAAQTSAAVDGGRYVGAAVNELGLPTAVEGAVEPAGFAGTASDGRSLASLLYQPVIATKVALATGQVLEQARAVGQSRLDRIVRTQVADAARGAAGVAIAARPGVTGWVRMLNTPSCGRCVVLAGRFYRWNTGFTRHPRCDCRHIPAAENMAGDLRTDPRAAVEAGQVRGLSAADTRAIVVDGADVGQVINARRGMYTADVGGRAVKATREAARRPLRLRPEAIYRQAGDDRAEAIRLLSRNGYLTT